MFIRADELRSVKCNRDVLSSMASKAYVRPRDTIPAASHLRQTCRYLKCSLTSNGSKDASLRRQENDEHTLDRAASGASQWTVYPTSWGKRVAALRSCAPQGVWRK